MQDARDLLGSDAFRGFFGTRLTPLRFSDWLESIDRELVRGRRGYLSAHHNMHSLYLLQSDNTLRRFYARCDDCYVDGMALRLILLGAGVPLSGAYRFSLMDTFSDLLEYASRRSWKIFYLGSSETVIQKARERLGREFPELGIELHHGYFDHDGRVVELINTAQPDLLLVGMGMPGQEAWLLKNLDQLDVAVACQAGATLDYFVGAQAKPPLWCSKLGLAWLYRLVNDPVRLWRRYLLEPWALIAPTLRLWRAR